MPESSVARDREAPTLVSFHVPRAQSRVDLYRAQEHFTHEVATRARELAPDHLEFTHIPSLETDRKTQVSGRSIVPEPSTSLGLRRSRRESHRWGRPHHSGVARECHTGHRLSTSTDRGTWSLHRPSRADEIQSHATGRDCVRYVSGRFSLRRDRRISPRVGTIYS
jgi:hypothetical protein